MQYVGGGFVKFGNVLFRSYVSIHEQSSGKAQARAHLHKHIYTRTSTHTQAHIQIIKPFTWDIQTYQSRIKRSQAVIKKDILTQLANITPRRNFLDIFVMKWNIHL